MKSTRSYRDVERCADDRIDANRETKEDSAGDANMQADLCK